MSDRTRTLKKASILFTILSLVLTWGPIIIYTVMAYKSATASITAKVTLTSLLSIGVILSLVCLINKYTLRSRTYLILIGLWLCLDKILACILVIAITQLVDELITHPLSKYFRNKYIINKEIDKRG